MKNDYEIKFNQEVERILKELYYKPISSGQGIKKLVAETEYKYVQFLTRHELVKFTQSFGSKKFGLLLLEKGYEVFEKYGSWDEYRKKVILNKIKIENAKSIATKLWWLPIVISAIALIISVIAIIKK